MLGIDKLIPFWQTVFQFLTLDSKPWEPDLIFVFPNFGSVPARAASYLLLGVSSHVALIGLAAVDVEIHPYVLSFSSNLHFTNIVVTLDFS